MLSLRRQQDNMGKPVKVVNVTPELMAALVKNQQVKGLTPATLLSNDAG
jgi:hypothetical protein